MSIKKFLAVAVLSVGAFVNAHSEILSTTSYGNIYYGSDSHGLLGTPGADLTGYSYSYTISFDRSLNTDYSQPFYKFSYGSAPITIDITVNNHNFSTTATDIYSQYYIANYLSLGSSDYDELYTYANGSGIYTYQYVYSYTNTFVGSDVDLALNYSRVVKPGDTATTYFQLYNPELQNYTFFAGSPLAVTMNGAAVPEPTTVALLGLGLLGLTASRRKAAAK